MGRNIIPVYETKTEIVNKDAPYDRFAFQGAYNVKPPVSTSADKRRILNEQRLANITLHSLYNRYRRQGHKTATAYIKA